MLFDDIVGGTVAAFAMALACVTIIFAQTVRNVVLPSQASRLTSGRQRWEGRC